ncbi:MAG: hypothetical protein FWC23_05350 [Chitinispirillia bacterium]|nr:hypothetical protein [Chitinispirillia bacterium]MCL2268595.1 hypothetical protein [Chitinispirillia bacterium]
MSKFLPLMRTGTFKDRHGGIYNITKEVLNKIVSTFDASRPPAILVGHPDTDKAPSFGIVEALKIAGDQLLFRPGKVVAEFAALVRRGGFPGVSAGLTRDLSRLDHVAMLSAQSPAIDGLKPIAEFCALDPKERVLIDVTESAAQSLAEFAYAPDWWVIDRMQDIGEMFRAIKNYIIERSSVEAADALIPEHRINSFKENLPVLEEEREAEFSALKPAVENTPAEGEPPAVAASNNYEDKYNELLPKYEAAQKALSEFTATAQKLIDEKKALEDRIVVLEYDKRTADFSAFLETAISEGRIVPGEKPRRLEDMEAMFMQGGAEFSSDPVKYPKALDIYKNDIMSRPCKIPRPGEITPPPQFAASVAVTPSTDGSEIGKRAGAYINEMAAKGVAVSAIDAVKHVLNN